MHDRLVNQRSRLSKLSAAGQVCYDSYQFTVTFRTGRNQGRANLLPSRVPAHGSAGGSPSRNAGLGPKITSSDGTTAGAFEES